MSEHRCLDCDSLIERHGVRGRWPLRCPTCKRTHAIAKCAEWRARQVPAYDHERAILASEAAERATWDARGLRQCSTCGAILPATTEWFTAHAGCAGGIERRCRVCRNAAQNKPRKAAWAQSKVAQERTAKDALFAQGVQVCRECGETKLISEMVRASRGRNGLSAVCKSCMAEKSRGHRAKRKYAPHTTACREYYNKWCAQPCEVCGEHRSKKLIHAHHKNPAEKQHQINHLIGKGEAFLPLVQVELSKCSPLCACCHQLVHDAMCNGGSGLPFDELVEYVRRVYV